MSESGADESSFHNRDLPVKDSGSQLVDVEGSPEGRRLIAAMKKALLGKEVKLYNFAPPETKDQPGRYILVDMPDVRFQACLRVIDTHNSDNGPSEPLKAINITWLDREKRLKGVVEIVDREGNMKVTSDVEEDIWEKDFARHTREWNERGGIDCYPPYKDTRKVTKEELGDLADRLEFARPNPQKMKNGMLYLKSIYGAIESIDEVPEVVPGNPMPELGKGF